MELGDSGWGLERCAFSRLLERLLEVPGAARLVLNYLGELDQEPELEPDANVIAVLLSTRRGRARVFGVTRAECCSSRRPRPLDVADCRTGRSPLHVASANGLVSATAKLMDLGANALLKDQQGLTPVDLSANEEVKVAFTEHSEQVDITDKTKNALLLLCAHLGNASRLPAVMKAGEDGKHA